MSRPLFVPWSDAVSARYERIRGDWSALRTQWQAEDHVDAQAIMGSADAFVREVDGFVEAIEDRLSRWTAILHLFQMCLMALAIIAAVSFMATSYWLVLHPVGQLRSALERMRRGHLDTRMNVEVDDEFGQLAAGFNLMAQSLQSSHAELEDKVREKTASLNVQHQQLQALYAVSVQASGRPASRPWPKGSCARSVWQPRPMRPRCAGPTRPTSATCCWPATACPSPCRCRSTACTRAPACAASRASSARLRDPHHPGQRPAAAPLPRGRLRDRGQHPRATAAAPAGRGQPVLSLHRGAHGRHARPAVRHGAPPGQRHGKPARHGAGARSRRGRGARPDRARAA